MQLTASQLGALNGVDLEAFPKIFSCAVSYLEGRNVKSGLAELANEVKIPASQLHELCQLTASILWDCTKNNAHDQEIHFHFIELGLDSKLAVTFAKLIEPKRNLLSTIKYTIRRLPKAYFNISWRLDIALARRNMNSITKPKFAILLELKERKDDGDDVFESLHLQADFANMKMIQQELQKAIDEYNGVHCQRMRKYIN